MRLIPISYGSSNEPNHPCRDIKPALCCDWSCIEVVIEPLGFYYGSLINGHDTQIIFNSPTEI